MRVFSTNFAAALANRSGVKARVLWWIKAKNRTTGAIETIGFWNGDDTRVFTIGTEPRTYYAAGNVLGFGQLTLEAALNIRTLSVQSSHVSTEIQQALLGYETRFAPTEIHLALFDLETDNAVARPVRVFKGWINKLKIKTPKVNEMGNATIDLVGATRLLTKKLAIKRSDQSQRIRSASDTFYQDVSITGTVTTAWGEKSVGSTTSASVSNILGSLGFRAIIR